MFMDTPVEEAVSQVVPGYIHAIATKGAERAVAASSFEGRYYVSALEISRSEGGELAAHVRWSKSYEEGIHAGITYEKLEKPLRDEIAGEASSSDPERAGPFEAELLKREQLEMALELGRWQGSRQEPEEN